LPNAFRTGSNRSNSARSQAAITASVPFCAPETPPLTGESISAIPFAFRPAAIACVMRGPVVERSINVLTRPPEAMPFSPSATSRTMSGVGRLTIAASTAAASSRAEAAETAPRSTSGAVAARLVSKIVSLWPASMSRPAIGPPIRPTPMKPRCSAMLSGSPPPPVPGYVPDIHDYLLTQIGLALPGPSG